MKGNSKYNIWSLLIIGLVILHRTVAAVMHRDPINLKLMLIMSPIAVLLLIRAYMNMNHENYASEFFPLFITLMALMTDYLVSSAGKLMESQIILAVGINLFILLYFLRKCYKGTYDKELIKRGVIYVFLPQFLVYFVGFFVAKASAADKVYTTVQGLLLAGLLITILFQKSFHQQIKNKKW